LKTLTEVITFSFLMKIEKRNPKSYEYETRIIFTVCFDRDCRTVVNKTELRSAREQTTYL
jgi:hypothetical protein